MNKKILTAVLLATAGLSLGGCGVKTIEPGSIGVKVNNYGGDAGVEPHALGVGTYWEGPGVNIYDYPVSTKTYVWTKSADEGKAVNEEIAFQDKNGMSMNADVGISYHVDTDKAPALYTRYHTDIDGIVSGPLRLAVRNALIAEAATMDVEDLFGAGRNVLIAKATARVKTQFEPLGLDVENMYWADIRYPQAIIDQINQKKANQQQAQAAEAAVATAKAKADAEIATATGRAKATQIEAQAIRANPQILQQRWIEKWDGQLPTYVAGNGNGIMMQMPGRR